MNCEFVLSTTFGVIRLYFVSVFGAMSWRRHLGVSVIILLYHCLCHCHTLKSFSSLWFRLGVCGKSDGAIWAVVILQYKLLTRFLKQVLVFSSVSKIFHIMIIFLFFLRNKLAHTVVYLKFENHNLNRLTWVFNFLIGNFDSRRFRVSSVTWQMGNKKNA